LYVVIKFDHQLLSYFKPLLGGLLEDKYIIIVGYLIVYITINFLIKLLMRRVNKDGVGLVDRFMGVLFGLARGLLIAILLIGFNVFSYINSDDVWKQGFVVTKMDYLVQKTFTMLPISLVQNINDYLHKLDNEAATQVFKKALNEQLGLNLKTRDLSLEEKKKLMQQSEQKEKLEAVSKTSKQ
jgi:uncharacterized membrane protein required for colicin V production